MKLPMSEVKRRLLLRSKGKKAFSFFERDFIYEGSLSGAESNLIAKCGKIRGSKF